MRSTLKRVERPRPSFASRFMVVTSSGRSLALLGSMSLALALAATTFAQTRGRLSVETLPPPPRGTRSMQVINADAPVLLAPAAGATRRGTLALGTRVAVHQRLWAEGCRPAWVRIGPSQYVCERHLEPSRESPHARAWPQVEPGALLPHDYAFIATDGTRAYARPSDYIHGDYVEALGEGFGIIVTGAGRYDGIPFVRTRRRLWVEANQVRHARGSDLRGVELEGSPLDRAWIKPRSARVHERPRGRVLRRADQREVVRLTRAERGWGTLREGGHVRLRDLHRPTLQPPPDEVPEGGTWIDVDVSEQVLVAYRGDVPVFATLVSTGKRGAHATPTGVFPIWVKLAFSDMDNLERDDVERNYAIARVPWVQYFEGANGLHAAFWHDDFGRRRSHGCVNLAPQDARWLYEFTEPSMPEGWTAIFPKPDEPTTLVQIRE